jgi:DNA-binding transcriptional ArsR family regulator
LPTLYVREHTGRAMRLLPHDLARDDPLSPLLFPGFAHLSGFLVAWAAREAEPPAGRPGPRLTAGEARQALQERAAAAAPYVAKAIRESFDTLEHDRRITWDRRRRGWRLSATARGWLAVGMREIAAMSDALGAYSRAYIDVWPAPMDGAPTPGPEPRRRRRHFTEEAESAASPRHRFPGLARLGPFLLLFLLGRVERLLSEPRRSARASAGQPCASEVPPHSTYALTEAAARISTYRRATLTKDLVLLREAGAITTSIDEKRWQVCSLTPEGRAWLAVMVMEVAGMARAAELLLIAYTAGGPGPRDR